MPKHDAFTPKAIANRIKAKGLQKLRWYCQMCAKQCRDENGFKCHITSESHLRQMRIFSENPHSVMENYSRQFEEDFLDSLSRRFGTKRTHCNQVYNEYISNKTHIHMNSTKWETLTNFVKYLGRTGKCVVDETEKGWYIQWINRDPAILARQEAAERKKKADLNDEERQRKSIEQQIKVAYAMQDSTAADAAPSELNRVDDFESINIAVPTKETAAAVKRPRPPVPAFNSNAFDEDDDDSLQMITPAVTKKSTMDMLIEQDQKRKKMEQINSSLKETTVQQSEANDKSWQRFPNWLFTGIIVKILNKSVGNGKYYKSKGEVRKVIEDYIAEVKIMDTNSRIRIDQEDLETVIPSVGKKVLILNGKYRSCIAQLESVNIDRFNAAVTVIGGEHNGKLVENLDYEDISKLAES